MSTRELIPPSPAYEEPASSSQGRSNFHVPSEFAPVQQPHKTAANRATHEFLPPGPSESSASGNSNKRVHPQLEAAQRLYEAAATRAGETLERYKRRMVSDRSRSWFLDVLAMVLMTFGLVTSALPYVLGPAYENLSPVTNLFVILAGAGFAFERYLDSPVTQALHTRTAEQLEESLSDFRRAWAVRTERLSPDKPPSREEVGMLLAHIQAFVEAFHRIISKTADTRPRGLLLVDPPALSPDLRGQLSSRAKD